MNFIDYYKELNISPDATSEEIKKAYRKRVRDLHPDTHQYCTSEELTQMEEKLKLINRIYEMLMDEETRKKYDKKYAEYLSELEKKEREERLQKMAEEAIKKTVERQQMQQKEVVSEEDIEEDLEEDTKETVRTLYEEIKEEERKYPFRRRHERVTKHMRQAYKNSDPNSYVFHIMNGTAHIYTEMIYQLRKLKREKNDSVPRYILRNRALLGAIVLAVGLPNMIKKQNDIPVQNEPIEYTSQALVSTMTLNEYHEVKIGDTLYGLGIKSGNSVETLKRINQLDSNIIQVGQIIKIPHVISFEELADYTESISVDNRTLANISEEYHTDIETIARLNKEAIVAVINENESTTTYVVLSDEILVPVFRTPEQIQEMHENVQYS